jgi:hypothetical protein
MKKSSKKKKPTMVGLEKSFEKKSITGNSAVSRNSENMNYVSAQSQEPEGSFNNKPVFAMKSYEKNPKEMRNVDWYQNQNENSVDSQKGLADVHDENEDSVDIAFDFKKSLLTKDKNTKDNSLFSKDNTLLKDRKTAITSAEVVSGLNSIKERDLLGTSAVDSSMATNEVTSLIKTTAISNSNVLFKSMFKKNNNPLFNMKKS